MSDGIEITDALGKAIIGANSISYRMESSGTFASTGGLTTLNMSFAWDLSANKLLFARAADGVEFTIIEYDASGVGYLVRYSTGPVEYRIYSATAASGTVSGYGLVTMDASGNIVFDSNNDLLAIAYAATATLPTGNIPGYGSSAAGARPNPENIVTLTGLPTASDGGRPWICLSTLGVSRASYAYSYRVPGEGTDVYYAVRVISVVYNSATSVTLKEITPMVNTYRTTYYSGYNRIGPPTRRVFFIR